MDKIHFVCNQFRKAVEDETGIKKIFIGWVILDDSDEKMGSGITLGEDLTSTELAEALFRLNGRSFNMLD